MKIYIVRHGETDENIKGTLQGCRDIPLNEEGINLAIETGKKLRGINFYEAFTSPLKRASETCNILLKESGNLNTPVFFDERIKEIDMGLWEGKRYSKDIKEISGIEIEKFFKGDLTFSGTPNGENFQVLMSRTQNFLRNLMLREDDNTYLVSTHGCALRAMLNFIYPDKEDFWHGHVPYNLALSMIECKDGNVNLVLDDKIYYDKAKCIDRYGK